MYMYSILLRSEHIVLMYLLEDQSALTEAVTSSVLCTGCDVLLSLQCLARMLHYFYDRHFQFNRRYLLSTNYWKQMHPWRCHVLREQSWNSTIDLCRSHDVLAAFQPEHLRSTAIKFRPIILHTNVCMWAATKGTKLFKNPSNPQPGSRI